MSIKIKNKKDKNHEKEISRKMGLFDKTPDHCLACEAPFDKDDKEMVVSWYVIVHEKEKKVNLYCPSCWQLAMGIIEEMKGDICNS